jgi:hypothetical protein
MMNSRVSYAHAHMKNYALLHAPPKTMCARTTIVMTTLGNCKHFRSFTRDNVNSKPPNSCLNSMPEAVSKNMPSVTQSEQDAKWAIVVYAPQPHFFPTTAPIRTDIIVCEEEPLFHRVQLCPILTERTITALLYVVPWPLSVAMLAQEVDEPCPLINKLQIIVYTPTLFRHEAPLDQEVLRKDTIVADMPVSVMDTPSSREASPGSSSGGSADALQLALSSESEVDVLASQLYSSECAPEHCMASRIEVRPDFSCASMEGGGDQEGARVSCDSSGYSCLFNEPSADDLNTHSCGSEGGECSLPAPCIVASTIPSSPARSIEMCPEHRPRTFAEVVSGGVATRAAVTAVNPATSAHAATAPSSPARSIEMRPEHRLRTFAEVVSGGVATCVAVTAVNPAKSARATMVAKGGCSVGTAAAAAAAAAVAPTGAHTTTTRPRTWADVVKAVAA